MLDHTASHRKLKPKERVITYKKFRGKKIQIKKTYRKDITFPYIIMGLWVSGSGNACRKNYDILANLSSFKFIRLKNHWCYFTWKSSLIDNVFNSWIFIIAQGLKSRFWLSITSFSSYLRFSTQSSYSKIMQTCSESQKVKSSQSHDFDFFLLSKSQRSLLILELDRQSTLWPEKIFTRVVHIGLKNS